MLGTGIKFLTACRICEDLGREFAGRKHVVVTGTGTRRDSIPHPRRRVSPTLVCPTCGGATRISNRRGRVAQTTVTSIKQILSFDLYPSTLSFGIRHSRQMSESLGVTSIPGAS